MSRQCETCLHEDVELINRDLVAGESIRDISKRYELSRSSIHRHAKNHIPGILLQAKTEKEVAHGKSLLELLNDAESEVRNVIQKLDKKGDHRGELSGFGELRRQIELRARLFGVEEEKDEFVIDNHPSWIALRSKILTFLEHFPEVFEALVIELEDYDVSS